MGSVGHPLSLSDYTSDAVVVGVATDVYLLLSRTFYPVVTPAILSVAISTVAVILFYKGGKILGEELKCRRNRVSSRRNLADTVRVVNSDSKCLC